MNKKQYFNSIRIISTMNQATFTELFGYNGVHIYNKLYNTFNGDVGRWLCYLDLGNQSILWDYLGERASESK